MAEFVFLSAHQGRPVRVHMGWNRALQRYSLLVEYTERREAPVYNRVDDPNVSRDTEFAYFVKRVVSLGLTVPKAAVHGLTIAPWRDGTTVSTSGARHHFRT